MSPICKDMNGAKCAEEHCDYWCMVRQKCIKAVKDKLTVELLTQSVLKNRKARAAAKKREDHDGYKNKRNIVDPVKTIQ
jgi:hypothetical protein